MTPEQRARDLMANAIPDGMDEASFGELDEYLHTRIAATIRQAQNDKLEEAARAAEQSHLGMSCFVDAVDCGQFNSGVRHAAKAVRSLKTPKD